ncbi:flagellar motor protein [Roseibacterium sp. SDUM158016]|uniref:flagellar motor switch protein FliG n=1 Tax=Roseicyclus sediminis TaxID=2980997 RepID=UPI0021CFA12C|nr:FliG C-terminal domain-containing protein [Roseibacterium sp. SDUM158016]MCU4654324.1 flagellar motor protein [Roseibacterium sp. SDUM158016]
MTSIRHSTTRETPPPRRLNGPEKVAILLLCLGEERGSEVMQRLDESELQRIGRAMSQLGPIPAELAEAVLAEFTETVAAGGVPPDTFEAARNMLGSFMPEEKVNEMLGAVATPSRENDIWKRLNQIDERVLARHFAEEKVATVATILYCLSPDFAARVLPLLEEDKMLRVIEWMMRMDEPPDHLMEEIEAALQLDVLDAGEDKTAVSARKRMADIFNKLDPSLFENVSAQLVERAPEEFGAIRKRMFTFDDMVRIGGHDIGRIIRGMSGNTVPLALKGAREELREHFYAALPGRSREMLIEELENMGPVRARDVREAQNAMVDYALELIAAKVIQLPDEDEEELID